MKLIMFILTRDLEDIEQKMTIEFEEDYSDKPEILKEINITIDDAFFEWLHYEEIYDEEDLAEIECMNPARFITERLDCCGYPTVNYSLEEMLTE